MLEQSVTTIFGVDIRRPESQLFLLLLGLLLSVAISTGTWDLGNSRIVMYHEVIFSLAYICMLRGQGLGGLLRENRVVVIIVLLWFVSVSVSLITSPYNLAHLSIGRARYYETLSHIVFFVALLSFLRQYSVSLRPVFAVILLSNAFVVLQAILVWHFSPEPNIHTSGEWFSRFPFVGHARHAGYNMMVAVISGVFLLLEGKRASEYILPAVGLLLVAACLFWLGGRGSMISTLLAFVLLVFAKPDLKAVGFAKWVYILVIIFVGGLVAHYAAQFSWNGISNSVERSVAAETVNKLSSGRLAIWRYSIEALKDNYLFGLGSQGYLFIPGKWRSTAMPHNVLVQFLVEWGFVGASLFSAAYLYALHRGIAKLRVSTFEGVEVLGAAVVVAALSIHGLTDGTFYHGKASFYLSLCMAIWLAPRMQEASLKVTKSVS
jgi:O-antigen ligase